MSAQIIDIRPYLAKKQYLEFITINVMPFVTERELEEYLKEDSFKFYDNVEDYNE